MNSRFVRFPRTLREGREIGAPTCCRWRYALEELLFGPYTDQCFRRGVRLHPDIYIPCLIVHKPTLTHNEWEHRLNQQEAWG